MRTLLILSLVVCAGAACSDDAVSGRDGGLPRDAAVDGGDRGVPFDGAPRDGRMGDGIVPDGRLPDGSAADGTPPTPGFVGFGGITRGAASSPTGATVYRVTKLADDGSKGTLRDAVSQGKRRIVFDVSGTITLTSRLTIAVDYLTIDGATAKGPGITIAQKPNTDFGVLVSGTKRHTHDLVISHVRFRGSYDVVSNHKVGTAILSFDADCGKVSCKPTWATVDAGISAVVLDHIVHAYDRDKLTFWGKIRDVTLSSSVFYGSNKALLLSFYSAPYDLERTGFSIFRNAFIENAERNPQLRGLIRSLEIVNNVVYGWGVYGVRKKSEVGEAKIDVNLIRNTFIDSQGKGQSALIYLGDVAPASCLAQGTLYTKSTMGKLWVTGNTLPSTNCDQYSTVSAPLTIPKRAELPAQAAAVAACDVLNAVGLARAARTTDEAARIAKAAKAAGCP
jgi:hypothetical protein